MCWNICFRFHFHEESMNQQLNSRDIRKKKSFSEKMDLWLFFHTHPISLYNRKEDTTRETMPPEEDFTANPMRESIEVIVG